MPIIINIHSICIAPIRCNYSLYRSKLEKSVWFYIDLFVVGYLVAFMVNRCQCYTYLIRMSCIRHIDTRYNKRPLDAFKFTLTEVISSNDLFIQSVYDFMIFINFLLVNAISLRLIMQRKFRKIILYSSITTLLILISQFLIHGTL